MVFPEILIDLDYFKFKHSFEIFVCLFTSSVQDMYFLILWVFFAFTIAWPEINEKFTIMSFVEYILVTIAINAISQNVNTSIMQYCNTSVLQNFKYTFLYNVLMENVLKRILYLQTGASNTPDNNFDVQKVTIFHVIISKT